MIVIERLTYTYPNNQTPAVQDVSLHIRPGQFVLLAGESGAGKSTLLRVLNGLVPHFSGGQISGRVMVNGLQPIPTGPRALSRTVGFVFQNPEAQHILDSVEAEIAFGLENQAIRPATMRLRVEKVLDLLELTPLRRRAIETLSGGERQKVAIAAALALGPPVLALDEPTSQLDPKSAEDLLQTLVRLNDDLGLTIVLAEHRLERVLRYADRLVWVSNGRVQLDEPLPQALDHLPQVPPLVALGRKLGWRPLPLTVKEARRFGPTVGPGPARQARPMTADRPVLEARNLHFAYNGLPVLRGVDVALRPGETVVLLGRNGSGKTTLLKCLVGLLRPEKGQVWIEGRSNQGREVADICRQVAYLPQNPDDLLFAETVQEELAITLGNHFGPKFRPDPAPAMLAQLGLTPLAGAYPRDLSVGQRQRVALAAVMITRPGLLLLDEPTRGLDYVAKAGLVALWRQWQAAGLGLLLVTHDVELAAQIADRVIVLGDGQVVADGPAGHILADSPLFSPQIARLFPGRGWLTIDDVPLPIDN